MAFYPQFPAYAYAYPMPFPNHQDYYMYPSGAPMGPPDGPIYFDHPHPYQTQPQSMLNQHGHHHHHHPRVVPTSAGMSPTAVAGPQTAVGKPGYNSRKDSVDSGISDFSAGSSRKTSSTSTISASSIMEETSQLDEVKEEPPFEEPDDDLCNEIVLQVEFYFSDANITKDKFLLKHVKRNKEGFVSLKLISSFKRVKHLTKDWRQVAFAIEKKSEKLEVNDLKTKVRRLEVLPEYDETTPSRTVVALNLPMENPTIENIAELFSACGDIVLIRILRPGNPVPADIKPFVNKHPEMMAKICTLVEFERTEFALKAVRELDEEDEDKMTVMELTASPVKTAKKDGQKKSLKLLQQQQPHHQMLSASGAYQVGPQRRFSHAGFHLPQQQNPDQMVLGPPRRRISLLHNMKFAPLTEEEQKKEFALNPNAPTFQMQQQQQQQQHQQPYHPLRRVSRPSFLHPNAAMDMQMAAAVAAPPWMIRRVHHPDFATSSSGLTLPPNVLRMPKGPDKGKGFQKWCRSRMENTAGATRKPGSYAVPIVAPPTPDDEKNKDVKEEVSHKETEGNEKEQDNVPAGAAALPVIVVEDVSTPNNEPDQDSAAEDDVAPANAAAAAVPAAVGDAVADSCSDSGHEDGGLEDSDEHELELVENERTR